jgi:hypothetical protein
MGLILWNLILNFLIYFVKIYRFYNYTTFKFGSITTKVIGILRQAK